MSKAKKIIYWVTTLWLCLGMVSTGLVQLLGIEQETDYVAMLGYPAFVATLLGIWKILGSVAVLVPKFPLIKEWAYAGFFFAMTGALFSHISAGHSIKDMLPSLLLLTLTILSWYFRPADRRLVPVSH